MPTPIKNLTLFLLFTASTNLPTIGQTVRGSELDIRNPTHGNSHLPYVEGGAGDGADYLGGTNFYYRNSSYDVKLKVDGTTGNVAIGPIASTYKLNVYNSSTTGVGIYTNGRFRSDSNDGGVYIAGDRFMGGVADKIGFYSGGKWCFAVNSNGGVAIGENAHTLAIPADCKLAVTGKIMAREIKVTVALGDYIFSPAYRLRPLSEVEAYVKQNGHLPEVPSAAEVARDGLNVGEMQNTLLKKIEELTLYAIEQNKKLELLQQENQQQAHQIEQLRRRN